MEGDNSERQWSDVWMDTSWTRNLEHIDRHFVPSGGVYDLEEFDSRYCPGLDPTDGGRRYQ